MAPRGCDGPISEAPTVTGSAAQRLNGHVSRQAVSLDWLLNTFMVQHPELAAKMLATQHVIDAIVKPATAARSCRFIELVGAPVPDGRDFFFVSHTWSRVFAETVGQLEKHFRPEAQRVWRRGRPVLPLTDVFVWFDLFAISQHAWESDLGRLQEVVADAEQTLMIIDQEGAVLTRIWCLYEAFHAGRKGARCLALLSHGIDFTSLEKSTMSTSLLPASPLLSVAALPPSPSSPQLFIDLDVAGAQATGKADLDRILADIEANGGARAMTHTLKAALVDGMLPQVPPAFGNLEDDDQAWDAITNAARMCQFAGRYEEAEPLFQRALAGEEKVLGAEHVRTLSSVSNLASLLKDQGKLREAEPLYQRARAGREKALGAEHPDTLTSVNNQAGLLRQQGKLGEAESLYQHALAVREKAQGAEHPETHSSVNNLALLLREHGKLGEAVPLFQRTLTSREKVLGMEHPDTLTSVNNLASLLREQGKPDEAVPLFRRAIASREKVLGMEHPDTLTSVNNLANLLKQHGKLSEVEPLFYLALGGNEKVLGAEHPNTLNSVGNLADMLVQQGKLGEAVNNLAALLHDQGKLGEAEPLHMRALAGFEKVLGAEHQDTLNSVAWLAYLLQAQGKLGEAEKLRRHALAGREKVLGVEHPHTLLTVVKLASLLQEQGRLGEAEPLYMRALAGREKVLGVEHPDTLDTVGNLVSLLEAMGRTDEAAEMRTRLSSEEGHVEDGEDGSRQARGVSGGVLRGQAPATAAPFMCRRPDTDGLHAGGAITSYRQNAGDIFTSQRFRDSVKTRFDQFKRDRAKTPAPSCAGLAPAAPAGRA
ncbi:hypothetical protein FOA52_011031 [Chlamydomonas sp. UWO 241]|nr:hypothetical protein FOA52_011031 [Chlamydomonas sp. UWO 241]